MHRVEKFVLQGINQEILIDCDRRSGLGAALLVRGPGIDSRWCHWGFFSVVPSDKTMSETMRSTQPLKMSMADDLPPL